MSFFSLLAVAIQLVGPLALEQSIGLKSPATLWLVPGQAFAWPVPPNPGTMTQALWRSSEGQTNFLAANPAEPLPIDESEGAKFAAQDFAPVLLEDGRTYQASAAYVVRYIGGNARPEPSFIVSSKLGLRAEIRLLLDPTAYRLGTDVFVKLYVDGDPSPGSFSVTPPSGPVRILTTAGGKVGVFALDSPGMWAVRFQRESSQNGKRLYSTSTLWFEVRDWGQEN